MKNNQSKENQIPTKIEIGVYWYQDENGKVHYDFEEMANEFEDKLSQLNPNNLKIDNMNKTYLGLASKVGHNEELTKQYNELLDKIGADGMLVMWERWADDNDIQSMIADYLENYNQ